MPRDGCSCAGAPIAAPWRLLPGAVRHGFTHFPLEIRIAIGRIVQPIVAPAGSLWVAPDGFAAHALTTLTKKLARFVAAGCSSGS